MTTEADPTGGVDQAAAPGATSSNQVMETARTEAGDLREAALHQARSLVDQATSRLSEQAETQTQRAGGALRRVAEQMSALSEGRPEEAGEFSRYAGDLSGQLRQLSERLDDRGFQGMLSDTQRFARRRPGAFLVGAMALGMVAGRLGRATKENAEVQEAPSSSPSPPMPSRSPQIGSDVGATPALGRPVAPPAARGEDPGAVSA